MKRCLIALTLALVMISGCQKSQPAGSSTGGQNTANINSSTVGLTKDDCTVLGGKVEADTKCSSGSTCKISVFIPVTQTGKEHERCISTKE
jgi:hypothetical protein